MSAADAITAILLTLGCFVALTSAVGLLRMPDFFTRIHPAGKADTLAQLLICAALMVQTGFSSVADTQVTLKLFLISGFLFLTTPASTHAIAKAAWEEGLVPWTRPPEPKPEAAAKPEPEPEPEPELEAETTPESGPDSESAQAS